MFSYICIDINSIQFNVTNITEEQFCFEVEGHHLASPRVKVEKEYETCVGRTYRRILHSSFYLLIGQRAGLILWGWRRHFLYIFCTSISIRNIRTKIYTRNTRHTQYRLLKGVDYYGLLIYTLFESGNATDIQQNNQTIIS
jgi:hypothetical protein